MVRPFLVFGTCDESSTKRRLLFLWYHGRQEPLLDMFERTLFRVQSGVVVYAKMLEDKWPRRGAAFNQVMLPQIVARVYGMFRLSSKLGGSGKSHICGAIMRCTVLDLVF